MATPQRLHPSHQAAIWPWSTLIIFCIWSMLCASTVTAFVPIVVREPAYTTNDDVFIVQGGGEFLNPASTVSTNQFMTLSLNLSGWDATNPPWKAIGVIPTFATTLATMGHSMSVSLDRQTLTFWDSSTPGSLISYPLRGGVWSTIQVPEELQKSGKGLKVATDPNTGFNYIPLGYGGFNMLICDPEHPTAVASAVNTASLTEDAISPTSPAGAIYQAVMPISVKVGATGYSFVWSSHRQSFFLLGGLLGDGGSLELPYFHEFVPKTTAAKPADGVWNILDTTDGPPRLAGSCMVPAYNGTKLIVFGGKDMTGISTGTIYILDVPTMKWTKGPIVDSLQFRYGHACSVSGDNFLAWGGHRRFGLLPENSAKVDESMLIYDIYRNQWVQKYERGSRYTATNVITPTPTSEEPSPSMQPIQTPSSTLNGGVIAGIVVACIAAIVGGFFIWRKRRRDSQVDDHAGTNGDDDPEFKRPGSNPQSHVPSSPDATTTYTLPEVSTSSAFDIGGSPVSTVEFDWASSCQSEATIRTFRYKCSESEAGEPSSSKIPVEPSNPEHTPGPSVGHTSTGTHEHSQGSNGVVGSGFGRRNGAPQVRDSLFVKMEMLDKGKQRRS
ncbi:hypothetical protein EC991_001540 [Linnemannia zychae]|nr:hypothetical protein EC991_001540 [Linnemannia zychae]